MRQLKRLLIIPLRKSLWLTHNAHHESIFIETRTLNFVNDFALKQKKMTYRSVYRRSKNGNGDENENKNDKDE